MRDKIEGMSPCDCLSAARGPEFAIDAVDVGFDRTGGDDQTPGDLLV